MAKDEIKLRFIRSCPDQQSYAGQVIAMKVQEYKALALKKHDNGDYLDFRLNHTKIIEGKELLEDKPKEAPKTVKKTTKKK